MATFDRRRNTLRGTATVSPSVLAWTRELDARSRAAARYFWQTGNLHRQIAASVAACLDDSLRVALGASDAHNPQWLRRRDIWGDGVNAFDLLHHRIQIPLVERLRDGVDGVNVGFSVVLYAYEGRFGRGVPSSGSLWLNHADAVLTPSLANALGIAI